MLIVAFKIELLLLFNVIVIIIDRSDPDLQVQFLETSERVSFKLSIDSIRNKINTKLRTNIIYILKCGSIRLL